MKNFELFLLVGILCVLLSGCSSFYTNLERSTPYLKSSSAIVTQVLLLEAVDEEDRKEKAQIVISIADLIIEIGESGDVSIENFGNKISYFVPNKSHWHEFATALILVYADFHAQAQELEGAEKQKVLLKALNKIAAGCKVAAEQFD